MKSTIALTGLFLVFGILFLAGCASNQEQVEVTTTQPAVTTTQPIETTTTIAPTTTTTTTTPTTTTLPLVVSKTYYVNITNVFTPVDLKINKGDTVVWTNRDRSPHTVTSSWGDELASEPIAEAKNFSHTFNVEGNFPYHCSFYGTKMNARIVVLDPAIKQTKTTTMPTTTTTKNRPVAY